MIKLIFEKEIFVKKEVFDKKSNPKAAYNLAEITGVLPEKTTLRETKYGLFARGDGDFVGTLSDIGLQIGKDFRERITVSAEKYGNSIESGPSIMPLSNIALKRRIKAENIKDREQQERELWGSIIPLSIDNEEFYFEPVIFDDILIVASCALLSVANNETCRIGFGITVYKKKYNSKNMELYIFNEKYAVMQYNIANYVADSDELPEGAFMPDEIYTAIPYKYRHIMQYAIYDELKNNLSNAKDISDGNVTYVDNVVENLLESSDNFFETDIGKLLHPIPEFKDGITIIPKEEAEADNPKFGKKSYNNKKGNNSRNIFGRTGKERSSITLPKGKSNPQASDFDKYAVTLNDGVTEGTFDMNVPSNYSSLKNAYIRTRLSVEIHNLRHQDNPQNQISLIDASLIKSQKV